MVLGVLQIQIPTDRLQLADAVRMAVHEALQVIAAPFCSGMLFTSCHLCLDECRKVAVATPVCSAQKLGASAPPTVYKHCSV